MLVDDHPVVRGGLRALLLGQEDLDDVADVDCVPDVTLVRRAPPGSTTSTEREVEVLELLSRGLGTKEIARERFVFQATVNSHRSHLYTKLAVGTRTGAVAAAVEGRIIRTSRQHMWSMRRRPGTRNSERGSVVTARRGAVVTCSRQSELLDSSW